MPRSNARALTVLVCLWTARPPGQAQAGELHGNARFSASVGVDSNPGRDFQQVGTQADWVISAVVSAQGQYLPSWGELSGSYDLGGRKFIALSSEDLLVQSATASCAIGIGGPWSLGVEGRGKDRRGGTRGYTDLIGSGFIDFAPPGRFDLRLRASGHRFLYPPAFPYSFRAIEASAQARYRLTPRHSVLVFGEVGSRTYNAFADSDPSVEPPLNPPQRKDFVGIGGVSYRYRGPVLVTVAYSYSEFDSNSFGQTAHRHRLSASAGVRLPWKWTLLAEGVLQFTKYPDRIFAFPEILLVDDENLNSLSLKLAHPLSDHLDLELQYALYHATLPGPGGTYKYLRMVGGIGLTWRL